MASMKEFLNTYYQRLIFGEMRQEQFVQFCEWIRDGKATDKQKDWASDYLRKDASGNYITDPDGLYMRHNLPDVTDPTEGLNDDGWEQLFKAFRDAFQNMDASKKSFAHNTPANKFLNDYFGTGKLFQQSQILQTNANKIEMGLRGLLSNMDNKSVLEGRLRNCYPPVLDDDFTYNDLVNAITPTSAAGVTPTTAKYKTDSTARERVMNAVAYLQGERPRLNQDYSLNIPDFSGYDTWFDDSVAPQKLGQFQAQYRTLLNKLRKEKKIRDVFGQYDRGKISGPLNKALTELNYNDQNSEDYVRPKREDELTVTQRISEWWSDTYSDTIEKYIKFKGDELFFSNEARLICKHLPKDLKKTDDLDAVLTAMGKSKEKLKEKHEIPAQKHLDWFEKTMSEIKSDPNMKKTYAGALQHGGQLRKLVTEIMIKAVKESETDPSAIAKAKTTLELLSVLHFGFTTSKIMDIMKDTEFTLMSDKDLSWNKNKATQFITKALDKSVKFAFMSIGYGITMAKNAYSLSKTKIRSYSADSNLLNAHTEHLRYNADNRQLAQDELNANRNLRTTTQQRLNSIQGGLSYADTETALNNNIATNEGNITHIAQSIQTNNVPELIRILQEYRNNGTTANIPDDDTADNLESYIVQLREALSATPIGRLPAAPVGLSGDAQTQITQIQNEYNNIQNYQSNIQDERNKLNDLINGTQVVNELNAKITEQENEIANWDANHIDKMDDLIQHWNMLETGRNTKTGPMYNWVHRISKEKAQDDLNANKDAIIARYRATHSIAA